jgi:hypothetical protein
MNRRSHSFHQYLYDKLPVHEDGVTASVNINPPKRNTYRTRPRILVLQCSSWGNPVYLTLCTRPTYCLPWGNTLIVLKL